VNVVAVIQARTGSSRLPNKIFCELSGFYLLHHVIERLKPSKEINNIVVATTDTSKDNRVEDWCILNKINFFRGSEKNVLKRYYDTALMYKADIIVRVTADDPFKDYRIIDDAIKIIKKTKIDFVCNNNPISYPEGLDVEVLTMSALSKSYLNSTSTYEQEHVTQYIHRNKNLFKTFNIKSSKNLSHYRWTLDTMKDYFFVKEVYDNLYDKDALFLTEDIYKLLDKKPFLLEINKDVPKSTLYK